MNMFIYCLNQTAQIFEIKEMLHNHCTNKRKAKDFSDLLEHGRKEDVIKCVFAANETSCMNSVKNAVLLTRINCLREILKLLENMDAETVGYQELFDCVYNNLENDLIAMDLR